jgi:hypothetical protein
LAAETTCCIDVTPYSQVFYIAYQQVRLSEGKETTSAIKNLLLLLEIIWRKIEEKTILQLERESGNKIPH